jgi:hypothetical protein
MVKPFFEPASPFQAQDNDDPQAEDTAAQVESEQEDEDGYEMLPFDDNVADETPTADVDPAALTFTPSSAVPLTEAEPDSRHQPDPGSAPGRVGVGRAQKLWPVEPIYTDIDDDLWDASDGEDDWRKRLH